MRAWLRSCATNIRVAGGPPKVLRMDNGPELVSLALQRFCENKVGLSHIPPGTPCNTATSNRSITASARSLAAATPQALPISDPNGVGQSELHS